MDIEQKPKKQISRKSFVVSTLRRSTLRWPPRNEALKLARVERGLYKCASCKESFKREKVDIDHINPVVSLKEGFTDWNSYIENILPYEDGWQILCKTCHDIKTSLEDSMRANFNTKEKKNARKSKKSME